MKTLLFQIFIYLILSLRWTQVTGLVCGNYGFRYYPSVDKCYKLVLDTLHWSEARENCRRLHESASLVSIRSGEQNLAVTDLINSSKAAAELCGYWYFTAGQRDTASCSSEFKWRPEVKDRTQDVPLNYTNRAASTYCAQYLTLYTPTSNAEGLQWDDEHNYKYCSVCEIPVVYY